MGNVALGVLRLLRYQCSAGFRLQGAMLHIVDLRAVDNCYFTGQNVALFPQNVTHMPSEVLLLASPQLAIGVILFDTATLKSLSGEEFMDFQLSLTQIIIDYKIE